MNADHWYRLHPHLTWTLLVVYFQSHLRVHGLSPVQVIEERAETLQRLQLQGRVVHRFRLLDPTCGDLVFALNLRAALHERRVRRDNKLRRKQQSK